MARGFYEIDESGVWHEIDPFKKADLIVPIRCKDCKNGSDDHDPYLDIVWCRVHERRFDADWFCADGERNNASG